jgi:hypothetical protein
VSVAGLSVDPTRPGTVTVTAAREGEATLTVTSGLVRATARVRVRDD